MLSILRCPLISLFPRASLISHNQIDSNFTTTTRIFAEETKHRFYDQIGPSGLMAILAGWVTTEVGRQPWVVYGLQRTRDAVSAHGDLHMSVSLLAFFIVYSSVFGVGYSYMIRLIRKGPQNFVPDAHGTPARPLSAAIDVNQQEVR